MSSTFPLILAGGVGSRLWPLSRENYPKQFLKIFNDISSFQNLLLLITKKFPLEEIYIITSKAYLYLVKEQLSEIGLDIQAENIIVEPISRNTAFSINYSANFLKNKISLDDKLLVLPSDQIIDTENEYGEFLDEVKTIEIGNNIVIFGKEVETYNKHFGYIIYEDKNEKLYNVQQFLEKPDYDLFNKFDFTQIFVNSGNFLFNLTSVLDIFKRISPRHFGVARIIDNFSENDVYKLESHVCTLSFDKLIIENCISSLKSLKIKYIFRDIGTWNGFFGESDELVLSKESCYIREENGHLFDFNNQEVEIKDQGGNILLLKKIKQ